MKNIIITGGDDGLGKAIAKLLSEKNNRLVRKLSICYNLSARYGKMEIRK